MVAAGTDSRGRLKVNSVVTKHDFNEEGELGPSVKASIYYFLKPDFNITFSSQKKDICK